MKIFMVAEKPSICTSVADALNTHFNGPKNRLVNLAKTPPVYEFPGRFKGTPCKFVVTSVTGHVFSLDFTSEYQSWDRVDPADLYEAQTQKIEQKGNVRRNLDKLCKGADALILWMDNDREGENICFEVINCVKGSLKSASQAAGHHPVTPLHARYKIDSNIYRAKFSAITLKDIVFAYENSLVCPNLYESLSVEARQEIDLKVGVSFSRFQTRFFHNKYSNLDSSVVSYGPCQTPTLGFCVKRRDEIVSFVPENFWTILLSIGMKSVNNLIKSNENFSHKIVLKWKRNRLFDQSATEFFLYRLKQEENLICTAVNHKDSKSIRPLPLNTVELLKISSKILSLSPHDTMRHAESLYLRGYISYPRTESTLYAPSFSIKETLNDLSSHPYYKNYISSLIAEGYNTTRRDGKDFGDHPPITPITAIESSAELRGDEERVYDLILRHFLASVSQDALYVKSKITFHSEKYNEEFVLCGKKQILPGFKAIYNFNSARARRELNENENPGLNEEQEGAESDDEDDDEIPLGDLPDIIKGRKYPIASVSLNEGQTSPPGYLTESELIDLMESNGIGTDASISSHINNIMTRNYVTLGPGRTLIPSDLGTVLVHGYLKIDPDLVLPDIRRAIELYCNYIAQGKYTKENVIKFSLNNFKIKFLHFSLNISIMDELFQVFFSNYSSEKIGKIMTKCGKCLRYMRLISLQPQRLYCQTCEDSYSLPQKGTIKSYKENKCPLDGFELLIYSLGNSEKSMGKTFVLCPYCYNHPPVFKEDDKKKEIENNTENNDNTENENENEESEEGSSEDESEEDESEEDEVERGEYKGMGCNSCFHPTCKHSASFNAICPCPNTGNIPKQTFGRRAPPASASSASSASSVAVHAHGRRPGAKGPAPAPAPAPAHASTPAQDDEDDHVKVSCKGSLVLDPNSKPNWKLCCNTCNTLMTFKVPVHQITPISSSSSQASSCSTCQSKIVTVEFNKTSLPPGVKDSTLTGCLSCDPYLKTITDLKLGVEINLTVLKQIISRKMARTKKGKRNMVRKKKKNFDF